MTDNLIRPRPRRWGWLIPTCLVAVVWSLVSTIGSAANVPADIGEMRSSYMLGKILGGTVLVGAVMTGVHYLLFLRKPAGELIGRHSLFVFGAAVMGALPAVAVTFLVSSSGPDVATIKAIDDRLNEQIAAKAEEHAAQSDFLLGGDVLTLARVARPNGIDEARRRIGLYRELTLAHDDFVRTQIELTRSEIESSDAGAFAKGQALAQFDRNTDLTLKEMEANWLLEDEFLKSWEELLDFLALRPRRWEARDGQISFYRDADLATFNSHAERIQSLSGQIEARSEALRAQPGSAPRAR